MYSEKKGGSHKMARPQQNWGLLTLLTRWASIWTMPNAASSRFEPPCGRAVYTPVRATIRPPTTEDCPRGDLCHVKTGLTLSRGIASSLLTDKPWSRQASVFIADMSLKCLHKTSHFKWCTKSMSLVLTVLLNYCQQIWSSLFMRLDFGMRIKLD